MSAQLVLKLSVPLVRGIQAVHLVSVRLVVRVVLSINVSWVMTSYLLGRTAHGRFLAVATSIHKVLAPA